LLGHGRWFFPGTPTSSTTKTGRHDIAEILLKVALSTKNQINQINQIRLSQCAARDMYVEHAITRIVLTLENSPSSTFTCLK
jgi:hypothetical protein